MSRKIVHVVGTGTIGEPLIGLLCDFRNELGIDEVTFHKHTPLTTEARSIASSVVNSGFNPISLKPSNLPLLVLSLAPLFNKFTTFDLSNNKGVFL